MTRPSSEPHLRSVADVDAFIDLLRVACDDDKVHGALDMLLVQPDEQRRALVHAWITELVARDAPRDFTQAIACLLDDSVAEKAYQVIFRCQRKPLARLFARH